MTQWVFSRGVEEQMKAFLGGFNEVVPLQWLQYFDEREIEVTLELLSWARLIIYFIINIIIYSFNYFLTCYFLLWWTFVQDLARPTKANWLMY